MHKFMQFAELPFRWHLFIASIIRLVLILYGEYHDRTYDVPYTDVDYKVFTDAARHVVDGQSPYKRHTYRYSPIVAYLMIPNVIVEKNVGKIIFSLFDVLIGVAVKLLVLNQLRANEKRPNKNADVVAKYSSLIWLYNPLSVAISTRGNADSFPCFFIILSVLFLQTDAVKGLTKYVLSGIFLGISIHLRLYPLVFSFPMYLSLGDYRINRNTKVRDGLISLLPNKMQMLLALSCLTTLIFLTYSMYHFYGYEFLFETYIYHLFRKDTRHNFSVLFYYSYLTMDHLAFDLVKTSCQLFEFILLFIISLTFGSDSRTLPFALFCQTVVLVTYNSVMTSQYFIWFLSLLPLVVHNLRMVPVKGFLLTVIWLSAQAAWLFYAYLLEFKCREVFLLIWLKGIVFFCSNIFVLGQLIKSFDTRYAFGKVCIVDEMKNK